MTPDSLVAIVFHFHVWVSLSQRIAVGLDKTLIVERGQSTVCLLPLLLQSLGIHIFLIG